MMQAKVASPPAVGNQFYLVVQDGNNPGIRTAKFDVTAVTSNVVAGVLST